MTLVIRFNDDVPRDEVQQLIGELSYRFGGRARVEYNEGVFEDYDLDEAFATTENEAADDIVEILRGMRAHIGDASTHQLVDRMIEIYKEGGEPASVIVTTDDAPPHGIERPVAEITSDGSLQPVHRVKSTDTSARGQETKRRIIAATRCPTCGAAPNEFCGSAKRGPGEYGIQHVHQSRIDAWYAGGNR